MGCFKTIAVVILILLVLGTLSVAPVGAEAGKADPEGKHPPAAKHEQRSIFEPALDLGIWTLCVFLILLFVLGKFAWKPMLEGLQKREQNIQGALDEARRTREEAQRLQAELQRRMDKVNEEIRGMLEEARRDAQHYKDEEKARVQVELQADRDRLRREIEMARDQAIQELWNQTAQLATLVSSKAIQRELSVEDHRRLVDQALAEFPQAGREWQRRAGTHQA